MYIHCSNPKHYLIRAVFVKNGTFSPLFLQKIGFYLKLNQISSKYKKSIEKNVLHSKKNLNVECGNYKLFPKFPIFAIFKYFFYCFWNYFLWIWLVCIAGTTLTRNWEGRIKANITVEYFFDKLSQEKDVEYNFQKKNPALLFVWNFRSLKRYWFFFNARCFRWKNLPKHFTLDYHQLAGIKTWRDLKTLDFQNLVQFVSVFKTRSTKQLRNNNISQRICPVTKSVWWKMYANHFPLLELIKLR